MSMQQEAAPEAANFDMAASMAFLRRLNPELAGLSDAAIWRMVCEGLKLAAAAETPKPNPET